MIFYKNGHEIRTWVSPDGKSAHASISTKPGPHGSMRHYSTGNGEYVAESALLADSRRVVSDAVGISGGNEVRGRVTAPEKYPPPPPAPKEPHLTYCQKSGELRGLDGVRLGAGHAGQYGGKNNPDAEADAGFGPVPRGNWRLVKEVDEPTRKKKGWPEPAFKLEPDPETAARVKAMKRDPDSFYIHAKAARMEQQGNGDSRGCIALDKPQRVALRQHVGSSC